MAKNLKPQTKPIPLTASQLKSRQENLAILDVRTGLEYLMGHIPKAKRFHRDRVLREISREQAIAVVCLSGHRSSPIAQWLIEQGYQKVYNLKGGCLAWTQAGYALKRGLKP
jgi:rhodanese-related sulfurtransferase